MTWIVLHITKSKNTQKSTAMARAREREREGEKRDEAKEGFRIIQEPKTTTKYQALLNIWLNISLL